MEFSAITNRRLLIVFGVSCWMAIQSLNATVLYDGIWPYEVKNGEAYLVNPGSVEGRTYYKFYMFGSVRFPETLGGYPLVEIGDQFLSGVSDVTDVVIPNSVRRIGDYALNGTSISSINLPTGLIELGSYALGATAIERITLPEGMTTIGYGAFSGCSKLSAITIPDLVQSLPRDAFRGCSLLRSVHIGASITGVGADCFLYCPSLVEIQVSSRNPYYCNGVFYTLNGKTVTSSLGGGRIQNIQVKDGVERINGYAFSGNTNIVHVTLPDSVLEIGEYAFYGCTHLQSMTFGNKICGIGERAFGYCRSLQEVALPNTVTNISEYLFAQCGSLQRLHIGASVVSLGWASIWECESLTNLTVETSNKYFLAIDNSLYSRDQRTLIMCPPGVESCLIPISVTNIEKDAFHFSAQLKHVSIPNSVTKLWYDQFSGCNKLTDVKVGNGISKIEWATFKNCIALEEIELPSSITEIGSEAFGGCTSLKKIIIRGNAPKVWSDAWSKTEYSYSTGNFVTEQSCFATVVVMEGSRDWDCDIPGMWKGLPIEYCSHWRVNYVAGVNPACEMPGATGVGTCLICGKHIDSKAIPALGHAEAVTTAAKDATCTEAGCTKGSCCSRCNAILLVSETLPALGHSGAVTKAAVEPTSGAMGATAEIRCSRCGEIIQASTSIPALGYVRNVTARQLWPHKKVEVCYTLADDIGEVADVGTALILTGKYGSTIKTASRKVGATSCVPGSHCVVWDFEGDSIAVNQSSMTFTVKYGSVSGTSSGVAINTSPTVKNGMLVEKSMALAYSPIDTGACEIEIDGTVALSSTNGGTFVWQPRTKGTHTLKHITGGNVWTRTVNVTALVYEEPTPNPPTEEDKNFSLSIAVRALTSSAKASGTIGTAKEDLSYSGTWTATTSAEWLTLTYATRNVGLPVIYTVAENLGVEDRTGYIYVSGHVFTVTQPGVGGSLDSNAAEFGTNGGEGTFTVTVGAQASWRARSNDDWISVETVCGTGETEVVYHVAPWNHVSTRSGTITAAGCTFTVNQTGRPMKLNETKVTKDYHAHDIVLTVDALASTDWGIALDAPWVSIVDRGSGTGAGMVTLAINENPSYVSRTATALIGTETLTIVQTGRPTAALAFAISPEATTASVKGANGVIAVEATPDLPWTATSQANWLTIMPGFSSAAGNGNIVYAATPNPTMAERSGTIHVTPDSSTGIAGKTHSVTQPAATSMISVEAHTFAVDGDSFAVDVTVDDVVAWTIVENVNWLSVDGALSRNGPGSVTIAVEPNMSIEPREATLTIAGHEFHVVQRGRTITLEYGETVFAPESYEEATIEVHPNGEVAWTAIPSDATWISIWSEDDNVTYNADGSVSGIGDATLKYMVTAYVGDGGVKTGWIQIGNEKVYVAQRAYDLSIDPTGVAVSGNAGAGSVAVPATVGDVWNAIATEPWIKLVGSYDEVTGNGTVNYTFTDNDTGETRTGKIVIAGEVYTITQAVRQMVTITATVSGEGGMVSGGGRYALGTSVTLNAVVNDDDHKFVQWERGGKTLSTAASLTVTADVDQEIIAVFEKIKSYVVNDEEVKEGTVKSFAAPEPVVLGGTTQLVCRGTSAYPNKGTSFQMQITGNVNFEWDLWQTNYWIAINQTKGGTVSGPAGWVAAGTEATFTATPSGGKSLYRWVGMDNIVSSDPSIMSLVSRPLVVSAIFGTFNDTLATSVDADALVFTTGGDANWTPVIDATAQVGFSSARSGVIGKESETWLETTLFGAGTLSFRWRADCEHDDSGDATWDRLAVFVNGVEKARLDGKTEWQMEAIPLVGPKSTIRWSFYRDDHDEHDLQFANCGWIDGVEFCENPSEKSAR